MPIKTHKRLRDPVEPEDGFRLLVSPNLPDGMPRELAMWDGWAPDLGPSRELHAAFHNQNRLRITWGQFRRRYLTEMKSTLPAITELARRAAEETIVRRHVN
jgi:uncharacterized protein YeaO (DUF488 family)